jgi:uncharacterized protein YneF (UPF0154 family)
MSVVTILIIVVSLIVIGTYIGTYIVDNLWWRRKK